MENNYLVSVFRKEKLVYSYYSEALDELCTIRAIYRDCEIEIFNLSASARLSGKQVKMEILKACRRWRNTLRGRLAEDTVAPVTPPIIKRKVKKQWERPVVCVETGQVFRTIRECSDKTGIPYMTITNCIKNGNATRGVHFANAETKNE